MGLNARGDISVGEIIIYIPVFCLALSLAIRHGFKRESGWIFLVIFSFIRAVGSGIYIAAELIKPTNTTLFTIAVIMESIGLSPMLLATLGFLSLIATGSLTQGPSTVRNFRILRLLATIALVLSLIGGTSSTSDGGDSGNSATLRHVGALLFLLLYVLLVALYASFWLKRDEVSPDRRTLLVGIASALPFLFVRVMFAILSAFSTPNLAALESTSSNSTSTVSDSSSSPLAKFNTLTGSWELYLFLSLLPEFIAVVIYCVVGTRVQRNTLGDGIGAKGSGGSFGSHQDSGSSYAYAPETFRPPIGTPYPAIAYAPPAEQQRYGYYPPAYPPPR